MEKTELLYDKFPHQKKDKHHIIPRIGKKNQREDQTLTRKERKKLVRRKKQEHQNLVDNECWKGRDQNIQKVKEVFQFESKALTKK